MKEIVRLRSISEFHEALGLASPKHPLVSLIHDKDVFQNHQIDENLFDTRFTLDMYTIMFKDKISGSLGYGRSSYDYQEGTLVFSSPGQVLTSPKKEDITRKEGWTLLFHPDLIAKSQIAKKIDAYSYFSYESNEALHLSLKEQQFVYDVVSKIEEEYSQNIDQHSQDLILSNLELLLNYCLRFYGRQFYTRTNINKDVIRDFETELKTYFGSGLVVDKGIPSTTYFGERLSLSTNYLSDLLKKETGKGIKEHIDGHIVNKAKNILLNSSRSVSEIAYELGYDYPQSFTRLFKKKTGLSPLEFRSVN